VQIVAIDTTELPGGAMPMSADELPLPTGAATQATLAALNVIAAAIQTAVDAINGKTTAVNTGAIAGTVALDSATLAALESITASTGGLTDAELRATAVPVSGPLTDAQLRAAAVPVSGALTDAELRATAVPVSGPLTDTQLRAAPVDVEPAPALLSSYSQAGVIAINTVLLTLDCLQHRSVSVQCTSMGTTGVVTPEWSNNNSTWVAATMFTAAGASAATFNAAGLWRIPVMARYLRLRLSTATTAGTTTLEVHRFESELSPWLATQPVSGTVTATVTSTRIAPNAADGHRSYFHLISAASTNDTLVLTGARSIGLITATNTNAAARYLKVYNKATAPTSSDTPIMTILLKPGETTVVSGSFPAIRVALGLGIR
jgi:hypothetical protein